MRVLRQPTAGTRFVWQRLAILTKPRGGPAVSAEHTQCSGITSIIHNLFYVRHFYHVLAGPRLLIASSPPGYLSISPPPPLTMLGKLVHLGFDAVLIAAFLAGIKRSTGLTYAPVCYTHVEILKSSRRPKLSQVPNKDVRRTCLVLIHPEHCVLNYELGQSS